MVISHNVGKSLARKLRRSARTFTGEDLAGPVIIWLKDKDCAPDDPVRQLLERSRRPWEVQDTIEFIKAKELEWDFHYCREVTLTSEGPKLTLKHVTNLPITPENSKRLLAWNDAVLLWSRGLLDRIRRCAREGCGELFFARFSHSQFHQDACRLATEVANPEYKKSRREYMRAQRETEKRRRS